MLPHTAFKHVAYRETKLQAMQKKVNQLPVLPYYNNCECKFVASTVKCARNEKKIEYKYEYAMQKEDWNNLQVTTNITIYIFS